MAYLQPDKEGKVYLPAIRNGWWGGNNWDLSMIEATMNIAVFTDDRAPIEWLTNNLVINFILHGDVESLQ